MSIFENKPPFGESTLIADPNYYRLHYQLLVQYVSAARLETHSRDVADVKRFSPVALARGQEQSRVLLAGIHDTLKLLERWEMTPPGWFRKSRLGAREQRLQQFLAGTVEPCTMLLFASWLLIDGRTDDARGYVATLASHPQWHRYQLRRRRLRRYTVRDDPIEWSYRAFYNLACYAATALEFNAASAYYELGSLTRRIVPSEQLPESDTAVGVVLWALRRAFSRAPGERLADLTSWAGKDPAFEQIRASAEFEQLLKLYSNTTPDKATRMAEDQPSDEPVKAQEAVGS